MSDTLETALLENEGFMSAIRQCNTRKNGKHIEIFPELQSMKLPDEVLPQVAPILESIAKYVADKIIVGYMDRNIEGFNYFFSQALDRYYEDNGVELSDVVLAFFGINKDEKAVSIVNEYRNSVNKYNSYTVLNGGLRNIE